ncbi:MAG: PDC sensor domain-containing protein [Rhodocyclaceae bacterium]|nr:PDC sensor domain-containing protein [Rhodocyclaceae bacterium]
MENLQKSIENQRQALRELLSEPLGRLAEQCAAVWGDRQRLNTELAGALGNLSYCKHLYVMDANCRQVSDNVGHDGLLACHGRDRTGRPYVSGIGPAVPLVLSQAYMSLEEHRPSLTAVQVVQDGAGQLLGYIGAYFGLRDLPLTRELYEEPRKWQQLKGDPSIRDTVFHQLRSESLMDRQIDTALGMVAELMVYHGVFHVMLHFSSSRAVVWLFSDPFRYRLLSIDMLVDPNTCLAYPRIPYPDDALVPVEQVRTVLERFKDLRRMDEMFYLRSGTLNIFNGIVGLTFSCDGSHYVPYEEFLNKGQDFWVGETGG